MQVLFRDKNPRDMAVISSADSGVRWGEPAKVGQFNWEFQGCPHVGGSLLARGAQLHALVWTGAAGQAGLHHLVSRDHGQSWSPPQRLGDSDARRGDLAAKDSATTAAVWDRIADGESMVMTAGSRDGGKTWSVPRRISDEKVTAVYPRIISVPTGYRAFWTESQGRDREGGKPPGLIIRLNPVVGDRAFPAGRVGSGSLPPESAHTELFQQLRVQRSRPAAQTASFSRKILALWRMSTGNAGWKRMVRMSRVSGWAAPSVRSSWRSCS